MSAASLKIFQAWNSCMKSGKVSDLLKDESVVQELESDCDANTVLKIFSRFGSKVWELKTKPLDVVFPGATPVQLISITEILTSLYARKVSSDYDVKFIISIYHIMEYILRMGHYDYSLNLKRRIEEVDYGYLKGEEQVKIVLNNLYLLFWNSAINLDDSKGDPDLVLKLRLAAIDLLSHSDLSKFPVVSQRIVVTSRHYLARKRDSARHELNLKMCSDFLEIATSMVLKFLKLSSGNINQETCGESQDRFSVSVKAYGDILIEIMRVHNVIMEGKEGYDLCTKYYKMCCDSENSDKRFNGFLDIFCDVFSRVALISSDCSMKRKNFHEIYHKLREIQSLSHSELKTEHEYCGLKVKSLPFLKASECVCRSVIDLLDFQMECSNLSDCRGDESSLLLILDLGGKLNWVSDLSYSLKFMAFSLNVVVRMFANASEDPGLGEYDDKIMKARELLSSCLSIEEGIKSTQYSYSTSAINALFQVLHVSIKVFFDKKLLVICEEFLMKYCKLNSKWVQTNEFAVFKDNYWWAIQRLYLCRVEQGKYRSALAALAMCLERRITDKYSSVFKEWGKVKICAQLSTKERMPGEELKLSTVYHILKENFEEIFSGKEISQFLKLELNAYLSKEVSMTSAVQDVCQTILEVTDDSILKFEAQLCLIELSCPMAMSDTAVDTEEESKKPNDMTVEYALASCKKLIAVFQREIRDAPVKEDVPAMLCVLGQAYYSMYLYKSCLRRKKAKELDGDGAIALRLPKKVDANEEGIEEEIVSCDVVPSQLSLKSSRQRELLSATLNVAVALWEHAINLGLKSSDSDNFNVLSLLKCIEASAHIYELYDDLWHCVQSWCLLCRFGDVFMKDEVYLLGVSNLMRKGAVSPSSSLLPRADSIAAKLPDDSPLLYTYSLGKCWQYLAVCEYSAGLTILEKIFKNTLSGSGIWNIIIYAHAEFLLAMYCLMSAEDFYRSEVSKALVPLGCTRYDFATNALGTLVRLLASWKDSGSLSLFISAQVLLLDITLWIGETFLDLNIPQEAYAHLKQEFQLAQKLLLPNRAVQFLSMLAFVDLMACNKADCEVKLLGMESIVDLDHGKNKDERLGDVKNLIQWLTKSGETGHKSKPTSFEIYVTSETEGEVEAMDAKRKRGMRMYSPQRPGSNYKFIQLKKCADKCFCEWCMNSGFQKAFSGLRVVKVCLANVGELDNFATSLDVFENANGILKNIMRRFKMMVARMSTFYTSLLTSEVDETVGLKNAALFSAELGKVKSYYIRLIRNMADFYLKEWENGKASTDDVVSKLDILISVVDDETKNSEGLKYLFRMETFEINTSSPPKQESCIYLLKTLREKVKVVSFASSGEPVDELEAQFQLWAQGRKVQHEVCKTPPKEVAGASWLGKGDTSDLVGGGNEPIPSVPNRKLPRRNLQLDLKKMEDLSIKSRSSKVIAAPSVRIKRVEPKVGRVKKDLTSGIKAGEPSKSNSSESSTASDTRKAHNVIAAGSANKGNGGESSAYETNPRRRLKKL
ncbi:uncharacterized protein LOC124158047 isoform X2 [Ischnura elegans]|uniref:uncharacterized protein LOC124158047 isoform X2 n=1 Tax=Ischnura elegans TaxID=197161 RepID=UPI001ED883C3|nr:uncharacterized protein LOC124158047 isoform X2 [Ischnura elegans]